MKKINDWQEKMIKELQKDGLIMNTEQGATIARNSVSQNGKNVYFDVERAEMEIGSWDFEGYVLFKRDYKSAYALWTVLLRSVFKVSALNMLSIHYVGSLNFKKLDDAKWAAEVLMIAINAIAVCMIGIKNAQTAEPDPPLLNQTFRKKPTRCSTP